jgi:hypothetical protein
MEKYYVDTVRLLLATLPEIFSLPKFAPKGGTAVFESEFQGMTPGLA